MEHLGVFGVLSIKKVVKWYIIRLPHFFLLFLFFFSSHTVWLPVPLPSHLIDTPVLIGCDQENEEKILFLGRVHKPP